jgi:hypothetical protein
MSDRILKLVRNWVRAEYHFRLGPSAYGDTEQAWLLRAMERLRRAVTGKGDLGKAFHSLGGVEMPARNRKGKRCLKSR